MRVGDPSPAASPSTRHLLTHPEREGSRADPGLGVPHRSLHPPQCGLGRSGAHPAPPAPAGPALLHPRPRGPAGTRRARGARPPPGTTRCRLLPSPGRARPPHWLRRVSLKAAGEPGRGWERSEGSGALPRQPGPGWERSAGSCSLLSASPSGVSATPARHRGHPGQERAAGGPHQICSRCAAGEVGFWGSGFTARWAPKFAVPPRHS